MLKPLVPASRWACALVASCLVVAAAPADAQTRLGVSVGGASTVALLVERRWQGRGLEFQVGTWGFRDFSASATGKLYVGSRAVEPFVGIGLWGIVARADVGTGLGLIARLPIGVGWDVHPRHNGAVTVYLNRALALKRPDPENLRPPRTAIVPLPELSYRWQVRR